MPAITWTSSRPVISRITRNIKNIPAEYLDDIEEWIGEALRKMKTIQSQQLLCMQAEVCFHKVQTPLKMESITCVEYKGMLMNYNFGNHRHRHNCYGTITESFFQSVTPIYTSTGDQLQDDESSRSKFPRDTIVKLESMDFCGEWYKVNYNILETSLNNGPIKIWYCDLPRADDGLYLVPNTEEYGEALFKYCRMMLIGAGHPDPIMNYEMAERDWERASDRAISSVSFPTPDEKRSSLEERGLL